MSGGRVYSLKEYNYAAFDLLGLLVDGASPAPRL